MQILEKKILPTNNTPEIILNPEGIIKISGRSMSENLPEFYKPIENWIDSYICNPADLTCIDFCLEYSSGTNAIIFSMLKKITYIRLKNKKFIVNWYYEEGDEDILEQGEYISSILDIPFNFIKISEPVISEQDLLKWNYPQRMDI
jgi:hypothetical protein